MKQREVQRDSGEPFAGSTAPGDASAACPAPSTASAAQARGGQCRVGTGTGAEGGGRDLSRDTAHSPPPAGTASPCLSPAKHPEQPPTPQPRRHERRPRGRRPSRGRVRWESVGAGRFLSSSFPLLPSDTRFTSQPGAAFGSTEAISDLQNGSFLLPGTIGWGRVPPAALHAHVRSAKPQPKGGREGESLESGPVSPPGTLPPTRPLGKDPW